MSDAPQVPDVPSPAPSERAEFDERLRAGREREARVAPTIKGQRVVWYPQDGSQTAFLQCPIFEALYHGTRGPGKTDALLWAFAQHVGKGHGSAWAGIIFRQSYPQLADIQAKSEKWFRQVFPEARFNITKMMWEWPTGERLLLRHMNRASDYWSYHGHEYPFIGWEELTNWATDDCYKSMISCCRCSTPGVPLMVRATTNPYGAGHHWVKERFALAGRWWQTVVQLEPTDADGNVEQPRAAIHGHIDENKILLSADPKYKQTIISAATNPAMAEAWLSGSWDIVAGGMFGDVWDPKWNVLPPFEVPGHWRLDRSFDWGSARPFSVGFWAESDGSDVMIPGRGWMSTVRGDLFRVREWYGWTGKANEGLKMLAVDVASGIVERELEWGWHGRGRSGPADSSIYDMENGVSVGLDMERRVRVNDVLYPGVSWTRADKRPGSVKAGLERVRKMMRDAHRVEGAVRERPGLFVVSSCDQFLRTVPNAPRDEKDPDLIPEGYEDHICDDTRYRVRAVGQRLGSSRHIGLY